jgi:ribosomal protein L7/L12
MLLKREKIAAIKFLREESPRQLDLKGAKGIAEALEKLLKAQ